MSLVVDQNSWSSGLCIECVHLSRSDESVYCKVSRRCSQILACRSQMRASLYGRQPSGRVRSKPLTRNFGAKGNIPRNAWEVRRKQLISIGSSMGLTWIGSMTPCKQAYARKLLKSGKISAYFMPCACIGMSPVCYLDLSEFNAYYRTWNQYIGNGG